MGEDCIFCKIVKKEIPSSVIYEDSSVYSFLDISPVSKGHSLVIPKDHYETLFDIPDNVLAQMAFAVKKLSMAIKKAVGAEGIGISMNNHPAAGQVVPHAHIHIIPRYADDGLNLWPQGKYCEGEINNYKDKIISFL